MECNDWAVNITTRSWDPESFGGVRMTTWPDLGRF